MYFCFNYGEMIMHKGFVEENPTLVRNVATTPSTEVETQQVTSKTTKKGKEKVTKERPILEEDQDEENLPSPSISRPVVHASTSISRSTIPESILARPSSQRMSTKRATGI